MRGVFLASVPGDWRAVPTSDIGNCLIWLPSADPDDRTVDPASTWIPRMMIIRRGYCGQCGTGHEVMVRFLFEKAVDINSKTSHRPCRCYVPRKALKQQA